MKRKNKIITGMAAAVLALAAGSICAYADGGSGDIDGDGKEEIMTIEPFHGNTINVYKLKDGKYEVDYTYPNEIDFAHALVGTTLCGKPCFVAGIRRVNCEAFVLTYENGEYKTLDADRIRADARRLLRELYE